MKVFTYIVIIAFSIFTLSLYLRQPESSHSQSQSWSHSLVEWKDAPVIFTFRDNATKGNPSVSLYYHDSLAQGHPVFIAKNDTRVQLNGPAFFFRSNAEQTPFLIYPGEHIRIKGTANDPIEMEVNGNQERINELNFFAKLVHQTGNLYCAYTFMPYHKKVSALNEIGESEQQIDKVKNARLAFLISYTKQNALSSSFRRIAVNVIESTAITDTLLLYWNNNDILKKQGSYPRLLSDKIQSLKNIEGTPFQFYYRTCTMLVSLSLDNPPDYFVQNTADLIERFDFIQTSFTGNTRDFLMAHALNTAFNNMVAVPKEYLAKFHALCTDVGYRTMIDRAFTDKITITLPPGTNQLLSANGKTTQEMQSLLSKYKGRIILIDFWASWCGPCRAEVPYLQSLEKLYANKNIAFIGISTDQKTRDWMRAIQEELLVPGCNFLLLNASQSSFIKRHKIYTIPRYILISKEGKVISDHAPRPSDPKLKRLIDINL